MGIPKFYRWLSERYPLVNQPGGTTVIPIIDNLYLDMNGIIHNCTHGNNPEVKLSEEEMVLRIFTYLDKLFHIVKPQKLIFMAIDGVAPRAKMNQQRARRFKSAQAAEEAADAARRRGEVVPEDRFDSNCITPGTAFMGRLGEHLRFFIRKKVAEDKDWQRPKIIFSGHDVPGEGEHKVMEYIRWAKRDAAYPPNTRHCLYGLDADLIMLSLVTHEPHFCLLREVVSFTGGNRGQPAREVLDNPCQEHFVLLQIGLLRDYFGQEFHNPQLPFPFDLERVIDDFVLFCMLVGNDFLPQLPTLDIAEGALDTMFALYKRLLPQLGGYLTHAGELNRGRLEVFLHHLAAQEADVLQQRAEDAEHFEAKRSRREGGAQPAWASARVEAKRGAESAGPGQRQQQQVRPPGGTANELDEDDGFEAELAGLLLTEGKDELELLAAVEGLGSEEEEGEGVAPDPVISEPTMMGQQARSMFLNGDKQGALASWKRCVSSSSRIKERPQAGSCGDGSPTAANIMKNAGVQQQAQQQQRLVARYYRDKMGLSTEAERRRVVEAYIEGLHWVLEYYYRGVASWDWYYPFHYAPCASDLVDLPAIRVAFSLGEPFLPFQQLLAVLPAASSKLLPEPYQVLMKDPGSPIVDFYPTTFRVDLEGKRADWEGIVLIPFLDEERLLRASRLVSPERLSAEERARNQLGSVLVFTHSPGSEETSYCRSTMPGHHSSVQRCDSRLQALPPPPPLPEGQKGFVPQVVEGTTRGISNPPGFPSLSTLNVGGEVRRAGVNVFGMASRKESCILHLKEVPGRQPSAAQVAGAVLGARCWVKWPYLQEGVVEAVSDAETKVTRAHGALAHTKQEAEEWAHERQRLMQELLTKQGVETGPVQLLLHVRPCEGLVRQVDGAIEKRFGKKEVLVPIQLVLRRNPSPDPRFQPEATAEALTGTDLTPGAKGLYLGRAHYGCLATVLPPASAGLTKKGEKLEQVQPPGGPVRVSVEPAPTNAAAVAASARRILSNMRPTYLPSNQVARRLGVSFRTLGRMTGNIWLEVGRDKVDVGLCVKNAGKGLYVPDFAAPVGEGDNKGPAHSCAVVVTGSNSNTSAVGWAYSEELVRSLQQYKQRYGWLWAAVEQDASSHSFQLDQVLPGVAHEAAAQQVSELRRWLKAQPIARRPMVKFSAKVAPEQAVKMLQAALPPRPKLPPAVELENVAPALLLPPAARGAVVVALAGGTFEIGDRVTSLCGSGTPPFGHRGTVVGVIDEAVEVLFDCEFPGGTDLYGRCHGNSGLLVPAAELLNLSKPHAVKAEGAHAPRAVRQQAQPPAARGGSRAAAAEAQSGAKQALAAAAAALAGAPAANGVALQSGPAKARPSKAAVARAPSPAPAGAGAVRQPKIPDESGAKGFTMGRGRQPPAPAGASAPQQQQAPGAPLPQNSGHQLLSRLQSGSSPAPSAAQAAGQLPLGMQQLPAHPPPAAAAAAAAPVANSSSGGGRALLQHLQRTPASQQGRAAAAAAATVVQALPPPGQVLVTQVQLQQVVRQAVPQPIPLQQVVRPVHAGPAFAPPPPLPPPHLAPGSALLQQLQHAPLQQQHAPPAGQVPMPPVAVPAPQLNPHHEQQQQQQQQALPHVAAQNVGQHLLASLQGVGGSPAGKAQAPALGEARPHPLQATPPASPLRPVGSGKLLLSALQQSAPPSPAQPMPSGRVPSGALSSRAASGALGPQLMPGTGGGSSDSGAALLHRLRSGGPLPPPPSAPVAPAAAPAASPAAAVAGSGRASGGDLSGLWMQLQQKHTAPAAASPQPARQAQAPSEAAAAGSGGTAPAVQPSMRPAATAAVPSGVMDGAPQAAAGPAAPAPTAPSGAGDEMAFWHMLQGASRK
ncbi:hypothetical protein N2152v2_003945 [Parachlorella kessleri]